jgi:hypothetical protein
MNIQYRGAIKSFPFSLRVDAGKCATDQLKAAQPTEKILFVCAQHFQFSFQNYLHSLIYRNIIVILLYTLITLGLTDTHTVTEIPTELFTQFSNQHITIKDTQ